MKNIIYIFIFIVLYKINDLLKLIYNCLCKYLIYIFRLIKIKLQIKKLKYKFIINKMICIIYNIMNNIDWSYPAFKSSMCLIHMFF